MSKLKEEIARTRWGCIFFVVTGGPIIMMLLCSGWPWIDHTTEQEAIDNFVKWTGLEYPDSAQIIAFGDDHGIITMSSEGDYFLVFDVDEKSITEILNQQPESPQPEQWAFSEWQSGPVPAEIGRGRRFETKATYSTQAHSSVTQEEVAQVFEHEDIFYSASERCCDTIPWHNGTLIVIDPNENRVWVSGWDY